MKAARIHRFGGPEVVRLDDIPIPEPGATEVLVRIHASSINPVDYKIRQGGFMPEDKLPITLGRDMAGVVERAGPDSGTLSAGDAVMAMMDMDHGANAEFAVIAARYCAAKPARLDFVQAGSVGLAALTAWQGLFEHGALHAGQRVLIHGAAGGVGHMAVQFARARGADVVATCSAADMDFVRGLGAATVIDFKTERFEDRAGIVDFVYDLVGGETQTRSWSVLRKGGIMVSTLAEPDQKTAARHEAIGVVYHAHPDGDALSEVGRLIDDGSVSPAIDRVLPFDDIAEAHRALEHDHVRGKIVLSMAG